MSDMLQLDQAHLDHPIFATPEALVEAVLKTCDTYPNKVNPREESGGCTYDDGEGNHCLIGQTLVDNGLPLPSFNTSIYVLCDRSGIREQGNAVSEFQYEADAAWGGVLPTWGQVAATYRKGRHNV